jgi:uncharacterized protein with NAD-binding domain and iron-sulfur cluster
MKPIARAVTIFGGGVTGLTIAHELIERGFQVEVWERAEDERAPARGATVGGMARTQWAAVPWPERFSEESNKIDWRTAQAQRIRQIEAEFYLRGEHWVSSEEPDAETIDQATRDRTLRDLEKHAEDRGECAVVYAESLLRSERPPGEAELAAAEAAVRTLLEQQFQARSAGADNRGLQLELAAGKSCRILVRAIECPSSEPAPQGTSIILRFRKRERWIPGEHGYRFFPSFYKHVFDTMRRTPILTPRAKSSLNGEQERAEFRNVGSSAEPEGFTYVETGRTVFDNLISAEAHALAFDDDRAPLTFPRYRLRSIVSVIRHWRVAMERLDFSPRDLARFALRVQEYALLSTERRGELESITWWEFIGGNQKDYYTRAFRYKMARWSEGLIAMDAEECDARSYGSIFLQLLFDQYGTEDAYRDGILNGPTSTAWFDPWRRYLEAQGVRFIYGELKSFSVREREDGLRLWPEVECYEPRYPGAMEGKPQLLDGYFVVATSVDTAGVVAQSIADALPEKLRKDADARDVIALAKRTRRPDVDSPRLSGDLRNFVGIQYYFREDLSWVHGHIYYPDAPWGLSSISQARFWQEKQDWEHGYRGVMSVIISAWDVRSHRTNKTAWESPPQELAKEVWLQLKDGLLGKQDTRLGEVDSDQILAIPDPIYWHLDQQFKAPDEAGGSYKNVTPFQINLPGAWGARPGDPNGGYCVLHNVVFAGTYMKTHTRINSMETANESGRHAANAILRHQVHHAARNETPRFSKLCKIFPVEHREPLDVSFFKSVDRKLVDLEKRYGEDPSLSLTSALGLDGLTAFLPRRRS